MMIEGYLEGWAKHYNMDPKEVAAKWEAWKAAQPPDKRATMEENSEFAVKITEARFRVWVSQLAEKMGRTGA